MRDGANGTMLMMIKMMKTMDHMLIPTLMWDISLRWYKGSFLYYVITGRGGGGSVIAYFCLRGGEGGGSEGCLRDHCHFKR